MTGGPSDGQGSAPAEETKLRRLEPLLRCPKVTPGGHEPRACGGRLGREAAAMRCASCGAAYPVDASGYDFLPRHAGGGEVQHCGPLDDLRRERAVVEVMEALGDGLALEWGAPPWPASHPQIVNFGSVEASDTDVRGIGRSLPFADACFDVVLAIGVLEHVQDPFRCALELTRVVRPGGRLCAAVPLLVPYHGAPRQYYAMTRQGLAALFDHDLEVEELTTPAPGHPARALMTLLRRYRSGLPPAAAAELDATPLGELMGDGMEYLERGFVRDLDSGSRSDLAAVTLLVGTKR